MKVVVGVPTAHHARHFRYSARALLESRTKDIVWCEGDKPWSDEEKAARLAGADAFITGWGDSGLSAEVISEARDLKIVAVLGGSVARFSPDALLQRGIHLVHTARAIGVTVAEYTLAAILALSHNICHVANVVREHGWHAAPEWKAFNLCGKTVSLVGCGAIGRHLLKLMSGFKVRAVIYDPFISDYEIESLGAERASLQHALTEGHVVTVHAGATDENRNMMGAKELDLISDGAVLVNTARASVFDEAALAAKLREGKIRALLDVFHHEPLPEDSPLRGLPNVVLTPHYAGVSEDTFERMGLDVVRDVLAFLDGRPTSHPVTPAMVKRMT